jgi:hypothetical protein
MNSASMSSGAHPAGVADGLVVEGGEAGVAFWVGAGTRVVVGLGDANCPSVGSGDGDGEELLGVGEGVGGAVVEHAARLVAQSTLRRNRVIGCPFRLVESQERVDFSSFTWLLSPHAGALFDLRAD